MCKIRRYTKFNSIKYLKIFVLELRFHLLYFTNPSNRISEYARVNIAEYSGEYLTWCIDGLAGYIMYHNEKFSITCHRGILLPTDKCVDIDLRYIKYVLEPIFRKRKKGREGDMGKNEYTSLKPIAIKRMTDTIPIPVSEDGKYDFQKQKELADKYEQIEEIKRSIAQKILTLSEIIVL